MVRAGNYIETSNDPLQVITTNRLFKVEVKTISNVTELDAIFEEDNCIQGNNPILLTEIKNNLANIAQNITENDLWSNNERLKLESAYRVGGAHLLLLLQL
jgi:hypothetical protein